MHTSFTAALRAAFFFALSLVLWACDSAPVVPTDADDAPVGSLVASDGGDLSAATSAADVSPADASARLAGRSLFYRTTFDIRPRKYRYAYARASWWRESFPSGTEFTAEAEPDGRDVILYLVGWDRDGRYLGYYKRSQGRSPERITFDADDFGQAYHVGVLVYNPGYTSVEAELRIYYEAPTQPEPRVPSLRYPLDRDRAIIGGYRYGDHWEGRRCVESGLTTKKLLHAGVDYHAPTFGEDVFAAASGVVRYARADTQWGGYIVVEHEQDGVGTFTTAYTHVAPVSGIEKGSPVTASTRIGKIASGSYGYGAHLDFKVRMRPYSSPDLIWILRGRFPEVSCVAVSGDPREPAFPEYTINPESVRWTAR